MNNGALGGVTPKGISQGSAFVDSVPLVPHRVSQCRVPGKNRGTERVRPRAVRGNYWRAGSGRSGKPEPDMRVRNGTECFIQEINCAAIQNGADR